MKKHLIITALMVFIFNMAAAQTDTPPPFAPEDLFADGITWTVVEPVIPNWSRVQQDSTNRVVRIYDPIREEWDEYDYPPDLPSGYTASLFSDGLVYFLPETDYFSPRQPIPDPVRWVLDPATGSYHQIQSICEGQGLPPLPGRPAEWEVVYRDGDLDQPILCHTGTGEVRDILPDDLTEFSVSSSPELGHIVIMGREQSTRDFAVLGYDVEADSLIQLGDVSSGVDRAVSVCRWFTETQGVLCTGERYESYLPRIYYEFEVTQAQSLKEVFRGWRETVHFDTETSTYISVNSSSFTSFKTGSSSPDPAPCSVTAYGPAGFYHQDVGYECSPSILSWNTTQLFLTGENAVFYLTKDSPESTVSTLNLFNVKSGGYRVYQGEIETILSVSPNARYAVLLMDDNGKLDFQWRDCCSITNNQWYVIVVDVQTGRVVYQSEMMALYTNERVIWLDDQTVIIGSILHFTFMRIGELQDDDFDTISLQTLPTVRRIPLDGSDDVVITQRFTFNTDDRPSPDGRFRLRQDQTVVDLRTFEIYPLFREGALEDYSISTRWTPTGELEIDVTTLDDAATVGLYHIRLPTP